MTLPELQSEAWKAMPPIRKRLVGRQTCDELVAEAIRNWSSTAAQDRDYAGLLLEQVRTTHAMRSGINQQEYGFIWVFLLMAVASAVIQWLVKRWLDRHFDAEQVAAWQQELAA